MRKLVLYQHTSLDSYCATLDGNLGWVTYDKELQTYADEIVSTVGNPIYGRTTYEMMKSYWPGVLRDPSASEHDKKHAQWLENVQKYVISKTLDDGDWSNTTVIRDNIPKAIQKLKEEEGRDLVIFGSPTLAHLLMREGLIDELQLTVSPIVLGKGKPVFVDAKIPLVLLRYQVLSSGVLGLHYKVVPKRTTR